MDAVSDDVETAVEQIEARGERIRDRELATALASLDGLDQEERREIAALADRLVERLLAVPTASLESAEDEAVVETALELFG